MKMLLLRTAIYIISGVQFKQVTTFYKHIPKMDKQKNRNYRSCLREIEISSKCILVPACRIN